MMNKIFLFFFFGLISAQAQAQSCFDLFQVREISEQSIPSIFLRERLEFTQIEVVPLTAAERALEKTRDIENGFHLGTMNLNVQKVAYDFEKQSKDLSVDTVIYPAAGYDASTAALIFSKAQTIIGLDDHPFINHPGAVVKPVIPKEKRFDYTFYEDVNVFHRGNGIAPAILGRLMMNVPGFRLLSVHEAHNHVDSHGWIDFDRGEGTLRQRYIHIDVAIPINQPTPWFKKLEVDSFQAVLIKGSGELFDPQTFGGFPLVDSLRKRGGVVVDADGRITREFFERTPVDFETYETGAPIGYATARILQFVKPASENKVTLFNDQKLFTIYEMSVNRESLNWLRENAQTTSTTLVEIIKRSQQIGAFVEKTVEAKNITTVVYPASGFDAATPFFIFPHAQIVVGMDKHPFYKGSDQPVKPHLNGDKQVDFSLHWEVDQHEFLAPVLLGRLQASIPQFRLRHLRRIDEFGSSHGWIEFDRGEGTPVQHYIHLQTVFDPHSDYTTQVYATLLNAQKYQGLLIKGSMNIFSDEFPDAGAHFLMEHMRTKGGVVVDADSATAEVLSTAYSLLHKAPPSRSLKMYNSEVVLGDPRILNQPGARVLDFTF